MGTSQTEVKSQTVDLSAEAFDTFCNDISGMFGVDMTCKQQEVAAETFQGIKKRFKGMVAVNCIKTEGALDGTFQLVFDRDGLFILAGIVLTLPEQKILENMKSGSPEEKEADGLRDALTEAGNLLAGSWDRVFREGSESQGGLEGHTNLAQTDVFIGDPWLKPEENIGLAGDEKLVFVAYEMTVGPYPAFNCGVIFPKTIFGDLLEAEAEAEEKASAEAEEVRAEAEEKAGAEAEEKTESEAEEEITVEAGEKAEAETEEKAEAEAKEKVEAEVEEKAEAEAGEEPKAEAEEKTETETEEETDEKAQEQEAAVEETDSEESDTAQESDREKSESQESVAEKAPPEETAAKEDTEEASVTEDKAASAEEPEPAEEAKPVEKEPAAEKVGEEETATEEQADVTVGEKATDADESAADDAEEKEAVLAESKEQPISEAIRKMAESPAVLPGEPAAPTVSSTGVASAMCTKDIMQKDVVWGDPDDSVHQALTKMQQYDAGYMMVGRDGVLEGIVSKSDIAGAISPYLRPVFAKWRRPADDATLQIKVKWIMIRPVHTIRPETSLAAIMENMCQSGRRALPVMNQQGKIQGLVTVFDVFKALLNGDPNVSTAGKTPEAPPLV